MSVGEIVRAFERGVDDPRLGVGLEEPQVAGRDVDEHLMAVYVGTRADRVEILPRGERRKHRVRDVDAEPRRWRR